MNCRKIFNEAGYTTFRNRAGELDSFYDPNKKERPEPAWTPDFAKTDFSWLFKNLDFSTKEGLEKAASRWRSYTTSDFVHDIAHDGDRAGARDAERALNDLLINIKKGAVKLGLMPEDTDGALKDVILQIQKSWKNAQAAEKRKATKAANKENRMFQYADELKSADLPENLKELFGEDGLYKERRSWGTIKDYFDEPYGKALKQLWVNQFGK